VAEITISLFMHVTPSGAARGTVSFANTPLVAPRGPHHAGTIAIGRADEVTPVAVHAFHTDK
jgi:hypothetical protein